MSDVTHRLATDETLQATNTGLGLLAKNSTVNTLAKDATVNTLAKDATLQATNTGLGLLAKDATLQATNTGLGLLAKDATLEAIAAILTSVKSVNGKYGAVVLDSGDILMDQSLQNSKTVEELIAEMQTAILATPLTFTPTAISGSEGDYNIVVTTGAPS